MNKLEIDRMVIMTTAHLSEETSNKLPVGTQGYVSAMADVADPDWWPAFSRDEGWIFWVPDEAVAFETAYGNAPKDLREVLLYAQRNSCAWVMFDRDGPTVDDLHEYDG